MAKENNTSTGRAITLEREMEAFELRKAGLSYTRIAEELNISAPGAHLLVTGVFKRLTDDLEETVTQVRRMELERLDAMLESLWPEVLKGNPVAINTALRISERRSKICGLDLDRLEVSGEPYKFTIKINNPHHKLENRQGSQ